MTDPNPEVIKQILSELRDFNKDKRRTAVMKLGMLGGEEAVRHLIMIVKNKNEDLIVRGRAALMLGKLGDTRAVEPLIEALDAPGFQTPLYAAQSLGKLGDPRAILPLLRLLETDHDKFREAAMESLKRLGYDPDEDGEKKESEPVMEPVTVRNPRLQ
jgi:HEAT repeat protein